MKHDEEEDVKRLASEQLTQENEKQQKITELKQAEAKNKAAEVQRRDLRAPSAPPQTACGTRVATPRGACRQR